MKRNRLWIGFVVVLVFGLVLTPLRVHLLTAAEGAEIEGTELATSLDSEEEGTTEVLIIDTEDESSAEELTEESTEEEAIEAEATGDEALGEEADKDQGVEEDQDSGEVSDPAEIETIHDEKRHVSQIEYNEDGHEVLEKYDEPLPEGLIMELDYTDYWVSPQYVVVLSGSVNIRKGPSTEFEVIRRGYYGEKFSLSEKVRGEYFSKSDSDEWFKLYWWENGEMVNGYVYAPIVSPREFRFSEMFDKITDLKVAVDATDTGYIYNVGNSVGRAPRYKGQYLEDDYKVPRYQAAPAYRQPDWDASNMRYMQDGILLAILEETESFYKVNAYDYEGEYYVPKRYVTRRNGIEDLKQVIVVDIANQNQGTFEYRDGMWHLISYSYATTGADSKYKEPTIPGSYQVIGKQDFFRYRDDITKVIAGYAPYALRFNGGAFIHGVPVNYKLVKQTFVIQEEILDEEGNVIQERVTEERIVDRLDPGHIEYSGSLGTVPLSHKCVRNITSHAKFLYDWVVLGEASVVVID